MAKKGPARQLRDLGKNKVFLWLVPSKMVREERKNPKEKFPEGMMIILSIGSSRMKTDSRLGYCEGRIWLSANFRVV